MLIFNFHHVEPVARIQNRKPYTITPKGLRNFIRALRWLGMRIVPLSEVLNDSTKLDNDRLCVLTFDDGYENLYEHAMPVLREQQCPAAFFVLGGRFSGVNDWDPTDYEGQAPDALLSLEQMQEMGQTGLIEYGSHGLHHQNMTQIDRAQAEAEILGSYEILSNALLSWFIPAFAYPYGQFNEQAVDILRQSRYQVAFSTQWGAFTRQSDPWKAPRHDIEFRRSNLPWMLAKLAKCRVGVLSRLAAS